MGAEHSTPNAGRQGAGGVARRTCYYEVLGVQRQATDDEIRKAYKKKALELHPDRNLNDTETATRKFAEVQTAYEVISDAQERAWYDAHRDAILDGDSGLSSGARPDQNAGYGISAQTIFSLMRSFDSSTPMTDEADGFFGALSHFFDQLLSEEIAACEWEGGSVTFYPAFGKAEDDYNSVVKPFYKAWSAFSTRKSFSWLDKYRTSEASDRRIRRSMEKENKKFRDEGIREFNDAVLSLVAFVKRRDLRFVPSTQSEAERQTLLRRSAAEQAARSRAANQQKLADFVIPEWAQSAHTDAHAGEFSESEEESDVEHIECVVCSKIFKSENQFQAHEKSKKHLKAVQQLRRQMRKENAGLSAADPPKKNPAVVGNAVDNLGSQSDAPEAEKSDVPKSPVETRPPSPDSDRDSQSNSTSNDEYAPRNEVENRLSRTADQGTEARPSLLDSAGNEDHDATESLAPMVRDLALEEDTAPKVLGKAKQKKAKRAARQAAESQDSAQARCEACGALFTSRTQLFAHLRQEGHATVPNRGKRR